MLRLRAGRALGDSRSRRSSHLVASSVPGLSPDGVSVVDQTGRLLSSCGQRRRLSEAPSRQVDIQNKIEQRYRHALSNMLTPIVGAGNFTAEVHADVDFSETQSTRESFPKDTRGCPYRRGPAGPATRPARPAQAGGIPGALSNQPPAASQVTAAPQQTMARRRARTAAGRGAGKTSEQL